MDTLPNFEEYGYRVLEKLSQNIQGGRITYKAIQISTQTDVVIKQSRFATSQDWSAYKQVEREIVLTSNASQEHYYLKVKVRTAPLLVPVKKPPYLGLVRICMMTIIVSAIVGREIGVLIGVLIGVAIRVAMGGEIRWASGWAIGIVIGVPMGEGMMGLIVGAIVEAIEGLIEKFNKRGFNNGVAWLYCLLTCGLGISIAIGTTIGFTPYVILAIAATSLPLAGMLLYSPLQNRRLMEKYHRQEQHLIKP